MDKRENAKLSLTLYGKTASMEWDYNDLDLDELFDAFTGLLVTQTFYKENIETWIKDKAKELEETEETNEL